VPTPVWWRRASIGSRWVGGCWFLLVQNPNFFPMSRNKLSALRFADLSSA
jgi:hypothetical protein